MEIKLCQGDLPSGIKWGESVAIDTEAMGLNPFRDRLCLVQISKGDGVSYLVQFLPSTGYDAPNLKQLLTDPKILKIFHYARFDVMMIYRFLNIVTAPLYCTKIASRLVRTYTDRHGLKDLCKELLKIDLSKEEGLSDWGASILTESQLKYAARDVLYLHQLKEVLDNMLQREHRLDLANACFDFIPYRVLLDLMGMEDIDIFKHS